MEPESGRPEHSGTATDPKPEKKGAAEKRDREWLRKYSDGRNPLAEPFGGMAHTIKTAPGFLLVAVVVAVLIILFTIFNPS